MIYSITCGVIVNNRDLYKLSNKLNLVVNQAKHLLQTHATRYKHFVDGGERGFECVYAQQTSIRFHEDDGKEEVIEALDDIAEALEDVRRQLDGLTASGKLDEIPGWLQEMRFQDQGMV